MSVRKLLALVLVLTLALALGQAFVPAAQSSEPVNVIIGFKNLPNAAVVTALGGKVTHTFGIIPAVSATIPQSAVRALQRHPLVEYVDYDVEFTTMQTVPWGITHIGARTVHSGGNRGNGIRVSVIDTGIQTNHPDLATYGGYNYVSNNSNYNDDNGHGTHVAGTVAALDNSIGVVGVAPQARLYGVKVLNAQGSGTLANIVKGIDWSRTNGMNVINMSLGASSGSTALSNACNNAYNANIVVVAAAGNSGNSSGTGDNVRFPARYSSVIAVAAVNSSNQRASWSSTGPAVELAAPGVSIYSTWPGSSYNTISGTSMAAPHVAGVAALVKWKYPSWTSASIRNRMNSTALDLGAAGRDTWYGWGLVRAVNATQ